ncbi:MAG TPA: MATE family efflux transporter, partial [Myxococcota bacterium]
ALGVTGAGWAAVLSAAAGTLMLVAYSFNAKDRARFAVVRVANLDRGIAARITVLSVFSGLATVAVMTGFALFLRIPAHLDEVQGVPGTNAAAAWDVITIMMIVFMTCIAFGTSTATLVAQSIGARKPELASRYGWQSVLLATVVMAVIGGLVYAFPEDLLRLFLPKEDGKVEHLKDAAVALAVPSLRFTGLIAPVAAAALVLTQALYGAGESRFVAVVEFALHFGCLVPLSYLLAVQMGFGLIGCWYATALYGVLLLAATGWRFAAGRWKSVVL